MRQLNKWAFTDHFSLQVKHNKEQKKGREMPVEESHSEPSKGAAAHGNKRSYWRSGWDGISFLDLMGADAYQQVAFFERPVTPSYDGVPSGDNDFDDLEMKNKVMAQPMNGGDLFFSLDLKEIMALVHSLNPLNHPVDEQKVSPVGVSKGEDVALPSRQTDNDFHGRKATRKRERPVFTGDVVTSAIDGVPRGHRLFKRQRICSESGHKYPVVLRKGFI